MNNNAEDDAKKIVKGTKKVVRKTLKIVKKLFGPIGRIFLPIAIIVVILAGAGWYIFHDEGIWEDDEYNKEKGRPSTALSTAKMTPETGITMDSRNVVKEGLLSLGYKEEQIEELEDEEIIEIFEMKKKLKKNITSLDKCTQAELLWCISDEYSKYMDNPDELDYLLKAELVTQYPKIDDLSADKLNGVIQFKRIKKTPQSQGEGTPVMLKFISEEEFNDKYEKLKDGNLDVLDYFTMDEEQNVVVATWTVEHGNFESNNTHIQQESGRKKIKQGNTEEIIKEEYDPDYHLIKDEMESIEAEYDRYIPVKTKIDYKTIAKKYTLPFEYLWSLLVMGESYDFVENLATLAYNSTILLGVYDNITTTVVTDTNRYRENFREKDVEYIAGSIVNEGQWSMVSYGYHEIETVTVKSNYTQVDILKVDCWIVEVEATYENNESDEPRYEGPITTGGDSNWSDDGTNEEILAPIVEDIIDEETQEITGTVRREHRILHCKEKMTTDKSYQTTTDKHQSKYIKVGEYVINPKVNLDGDPLDNFVELLRDDQKAYNLLTNPSVVEWLVGVLEENKDTFNMVELTRYLIEKAKHPEKTDEELGISFDFELRFTPSNLNAANSFTGNSIQEKLWIALRLAGFSEVATAAAMGNIDWESGGFNSALIEYGSGLGIGLCQWSYDPKTGTGGRREQLEAFAASRGVDVTDEDLQIEFLLGELGVSGYAEGFADNQWAGNASRYKIWMNSTDIAEATEAFCRGFERPSELKMHLADRIESAQKWYDVYVNMDLQYINISLGYTELTGRSALSMQNMLADAMRIVEDDSYVYVYGARHGDLMNDNIKAFDCSSFVGYLYKKHFGVSVPGDTGSYGSQYYVGEFDQVQLQMGDILWRDGHVAIYYGGDTYLHASSPTNGIIKSTLKRGRFTKVYRVITE